MIVLFNPCSTSPGKQPLPLSLLSLAAVLGDAEPWRLVDGNRESDPYAAIVSRGDMTTGELALLAVTVMPGPQLTQAVDVCRRVRHSHPHIRIVWGGYFPTQHADTVVQSTYVDFVVRSQGEVPLPRLVAALRGKTPLEDVPGLSWQREDGTIAHNATVAMIPLDQLPDLPYHRLPMEDYIHPTCLGARTAAHNSSFGCPFSCSFCAVVAMTNRRWLAQSPDRVERAVRHLVDRYRVDSIQMHDMDFFISEARVAECAARLRPVGITWWALGRIDTLMQYSDRTWSAMAASGLKMVFSGAESASEEVLKTMNKGGNASPVLTLALAERMKRYGIVPEFSFVIGTPPDPLGDLARTFAFIRKIKAINPATEIILYTYTPVPTDGALYSEASRLGFRFPTTLDEWASDKWQQTALRRGDGIPWMDATVKRRVRNFERVLNAFYPTSTDRRLTGATRALLRSISAWRYALRVYAAPYELKALQRLIHYQRPETTGF